MLYATAFDCMRLWSWSIAPSYGFMHMPKTNGGERLPVYHTSCTSSYSVLISGVLQYFMYFQLQCTHFRCAAVLHVLPATVYSFQVCCSTLCTYWETLCICVYVYACGLFPTYRIRRTSKCHMWSIVRSHKYCWLCVLAAAVLSPISYHVLYIICFRNQILRMFCHCSKVQFHLYLVSVCAPSVKYADGLVGHFSLF